MLNISELEVHSMRKIFVYAAIGIVLGVLVAFIPLTLFSLMVPLEKHEYFGYGYLRTGELEGATTETMHGSLPFSLVLYEICILVVPALVIALLAYEFFMKRKHYKHET